jgi:glycosyltransferase involved in cell wall biosynthesis
MQIYQKAWALIFPSIWEEPLPYAIIESLMTQTVPLSSEVGGIPELIESNEVKKFLFKPGDIKELYEGLLTISMMTKEDLIELSPCLAKISQHLLHKILCEDNIRKEFLRILF